MPSSPLVRRVRRALRRTEPGPDERGRLEALRPVFRTDWYLEGGGRRADSSPLAAIRDYLTRGHRLSISPHPLFDPVWYADQAGELPTGTTALEHYLSEGAARGLSPHPLFDPRSEAALAAPAGTNPLVHYLTERATWDLATCDLFVGADYLARNRDVARRGVNPLVHYVRRGDLEGRRPHRLFDPNTYRAFARLGKQRNALAHYLATREGRFDPSTRDIRFPEHAEPEVSVIVPVHGKWDYTRECLRALTRLRTEHTFEVVVVDDASPDDTAARLAGLPGVRVVTHEQNTGYVGACNSGIEAARGELVVLLNNDTRVDSRWLDPLVETLADPTVGLVGSKLIYPTGLLQEAGGVIYSDGTGLNYGKADRPDAGEYEYVRDVDYCSGASIMLRAADLRRLGGLSTELAPAYYDDTDLAFSVRAAGLRVVYQPRSVVVHDEGVSHGTDVKQGIKAYQEVNRVKFTEKWADVLAGHLPPGAASAQPGARRLQGHDVVVVFDKYVPKPDEDSGSVRMMALLTELRAQGHAVVFVPQDRRKHQAYGEALQQLGIEVVTDQRNVFAYLRSLSDVVSTVILSRVRVAAAHLEEVRKVLPRSTVVFDTVDLHFLRVQREAELFGDATPPSAIRALREIELSMVRAADVTLVVSPVERALLADLVPEADVRVLSNVHQRLEVDTPATDRSGLMFVGSFIHAPNIDALRWFTADVLPLVRARRPDVTLQVVGRDPVAELVEAAPPGVEYLGWVDDLAPLYAGTRAALAPLRFGAGVKGKIGEALSHGVPVVTTSVGAEGMGLVDGESALVGDSAEEFADRVVRVLEDDDLWARLSAEGREHIDRTLGTEAFARTVSELLALRPLEA